MPTRDLHRGREVNLLWPAVRSLDRPCLAFPPLVDAELEGAPARDAPENGRELLIVFELEPIDEAVAIPMVVHGFEQRLAVKGLERVGPKPLSERGVVALKL